MFACQPQSSALARALPETPGAQADLEQRARELILARLETSGADTEDLGIEFAGAPSGLPAHSAWHRPTPNALAGRMRRGVRVVVATTSGGAGKEVAVSAAGNFVLRGLTPGRHFLRVVGDGYEAEEPFEIGAEEQLEAHLSLRTDVRPGGEQLRTATLTVAAPESIEGTIEAAYAAAAVRSGSVVDTFTAVLGGGGGQAIGMSRFLPRQRNDPGLSVEEWRSVTAELTDLYEDFADASRGPERFGAHFAERMDVYGGFPQNPRDWSGDAFAGVLGADDFRRFVSLALDARVLDVWLAIEGRCPSAICQANWMNDVNARAWIEDGGDRDDAAELAGVIGFMEELTGRMRSWIEGGGDRDDAAELAGVVGFMEELTGRMRSELEAMGALDPEHLSVLTPFVRRLAGEGRLGKTANPDELGGLPTSETLYLAHAFPFLRLARIEGRLQIVAIYFGG